MKIDGVFSAINIGDIGYVGGSFGAIVDAFDFCDVGDVIDDDGFAWRFNNFLHEIGVRAFVNYFPCICTCVKYLNRSAKREKATIN